MRDVVRRARAGGDRVGFVPTMGALHEGHLRLVDEARGRTETVVMSVFVNPLQFGRGEDFTRYPRDPAGDAAKAAARGVDILFAPDDAVMYPKPVEVTVAPPPLAARWEGAVRTGHFAGVLTVVAKLFNIVAPDVAVFGQKDLQQATIVSRMVRDLDFAVEVVVAPTVREPDGLAMSSRNAYLEAPDRRRALALFESLGAAARAYAGGERDARVLAAAGRAVLALDPGVAVDYFAVVDPETFDEPDHAGPTSVAIVAARVGRTRLIDNLRLAETA